MLFHPNKLVVLGPEVNAHASTSWLASAPAESTAATATWSIKILEMHLMKPRPFGLQHELCVCPTTVVRTAHVIAVRVRKPAASSLNMVAENVEQQVQHESISYCSSCSSCCYTYSRLPAATATATAATAIVTAAAAATTATTITSTAAAATATTTATATASYCHCICSLPPPPLPLLLLLLLLLLPPKHWTVPDQPRIGLPSLTSSSATSST